MLNAPMEGLMNLYDAGVYYLCFFGPQKWRQAFGGSGYLGWGDVFLENLLIEVTRESTALGSDRGKTKEI